MLRTPIFLQLHKNGKGLLLRDRSTNRWQFEWSQSTIKMKKGYYVTPLRRYKGTIFLVTIHNKNKKGLLQF